MTDLERNTIRIASAWISNSKCIYTKDCYLCEFNLLISLYSQRMCILISGGPSPTGQCTAYLERFTKEELLEVLI